MQKEKAKPNNPDITPKKCMPATKKENTKKEEEKLGEISTVAHSSLSLMKMCCFYHGLLVSSHPGLLPPSQFRVFPA